MNRLSQGTKLIIIPLNMLYRSLYDTLPFIIFIVLLFIMHLNLNTVKELYILAILPIMSRGPIIRVVLSKITKPHIIKKNIRTLIKLGETTILPLKLYKIIGINIIKRHSSGGGTGKKAVENMTKTMQEGAPKTTKPITPTSYRPKPCIDSNQERPRTRKIMNNRGEQQKEFMKNSRKMEQDSKKFQEKRFPKKNIDTTSDTTTTSLSETKRRILEHLQSETKSGLHKSGASSRSTYTVSSSSKSTSTCTSTTTSNNQNQNQSSSELKTNTVHETSIPKAPPLPKNNNNNTKAIPVVDGINPETLNEAKKKIFSGKALSVNELNRALQNTPKRFKSLSSQEVYVPSISQETVMESITKTQTLKFLQERGLIKDLEKGDAVMILLKNDNIIFLGVRKGDKRLTAIGSAYHNKIITARFHDHPEEYLKDDITPARGDVLIIKAENTDSVVETPGLTHLCHGYLIENHYYISGIYSSTLKGKPVVLSSVQYKDYETQKKSLKNDSDIIGGKKPQAFIPKKNLQKIHKDHVVVPKWSKEYLAFIKQDAYFGRLLEEQQQHAIVPFDNIGVTKQESLRMCLDMDYTSAKAQKHPATLDQMIDTNNKNKPLFEDKNDDKKDDIK